MQNVMHIMMGGYDDGRANPVQQYDANSREFVCHLWERPGVMYQMAEDAVVGAMFEWRRNPPSKEYETKILNRSTVVVKVPSAATQLTGMVKLQLKIHQGGGVLHSPKIEFAVLESLQASDTETDEPALLLEALVERAADAIESAENAAQAAVDAAEKLPDDLAEEVAKGIKAHDESENAHVDMRKKLKELEGGVVTAGEKEAWNAKSNFSGKYADLDGKPEIPTKLPNPAKIVFTGGAEGEYDGSEEFVLDIPDDVVVIKLDWEGEHSTSSHTYAQITDALAQEKTIQLANVTGVYHYTGTEGANYVFTMLRYQQNAVSEQPGVYVSKITIDEDNNVTRTEYEIADTPNPEKLTFTGAANGEYDGSKEVTIRIPDAPVKSVNGQVGDVVLEDVFIVRASGRHFTVDGREYFVAIQADKTAQEIRGAVADGKTCLMVDDDGAVLPYLKEMEYTFEGSAPWPSYPTFVRPSEIKDYQDDWGINYLLVKEDGSIIDLTDGGIRHPNPHPIMFTGAVSAEYDGSEAVTIPIPTGGAGGGLPTGEAPHQMLVTDADGAAKWENRTHYSFVEDAEIVPSSEMISMGDEGFVLTDPISQLPYTGASCVVTWNGVDYGCVAEEFDMNGTVAIALGNTSIAGGTQTTNDPFVLVLLPPEFVAEMGVSAIAMPLDGSTAVTVAVTGQIETVKKLDEKFIPEMPEVLIVTITRTDDSNSTLVADHTFEEIRDAYNKGKMLFCCYAESFAGGIIRTYWFSLSYVERNAFYFDNIQARVKLLPQTLKIDASNMIDITFSVSLQLLELQMLESGGLFLRSENGKDYKIVVSADGTLVIGDENDGGKKLLTADTMPVATTDTLGAVKVGTGLQMDGDVLNAEVKKEYVDQLHENTTLNYSNLLGTLQAMMQNNEKRYALKTPVVAYDGTLTPNTVYTEELSGAVAFVLSTPEDATHENRIRMLANVAADTTIDWGTTYYYGAAVPFVTEGMYEFVWEYNPLIGAWVAGATRIGQVVSE